MERDAVFNGMISYKLYVSKSIFYTNCGLINFAASDHKCLQQCTKSHSTQPIAITLMARETQMLTLQ